MSYGQLQPGRTYHPDQSTYKFNGKRDDSEWNANDGGMYDYGFRIYDPRIAKFLSVDPLTKDYPWNSPYSYAEGSPVAFIDQDGLEKQWYDKTGKPVAGAYTDKEGAKLGLVGYTQAQEVKKEQELLVMHFKPRTTLPATPTNNTTTTQAHENENQSDPMINGELKISIGLAVGLKGTIMGHGVGAEADITSDVFTISPSQSSLGKFSIAGKLHNPNLNVNLSAASALGSIKGSINGDVDIISGYKFTGTSSEGTFAGMNTTINSTGGELVNKVQLLEGELGLGLIKVSGNISSVDFNLFGSTKPSVASNYYEPGVARSDNTSVAK